MFLIRQLTLFIIILQISIIRGQDTMKFKKLTFAEKEIILHKGTEQPFTGKYNEFNGVGTYVCKQCGAELYRSNDKFNSHCGWPSFDDEISGAVTRKPDADGRRTEILCANCGGHLGHVFIGEQYTEKNTRHCVNSLSLDFLPAKRPTETAIFGGGCFWGMEYHFQKKSGVISTQVGYAGGDKKNPTYEDVCADNTGHAEVVKVVFDPLKISYEELTMLFFEIHDPTQVDRQGPDIGKQYRSEIFYTNEEQREIAEKLIKLLESKGYNIATEITESNTFWEAESYHQDYYSKKGGLPYCHSYKKRF
jgi:peptide methionine sulfoxide reductase msrA/msrB